MPFDQVYSSHFKTKFTFLFALISTGSHFDHALGKRKMLLTANGKTNYKADTTDTFEPRREKTNVLVSDLVRHKTGSTASEDG